MNIIKIPKGDMCLVCIHLKRVCNHLPFDTYRPMGKPDEDGFMEVKCEDFVKKED